MAQRKAKKSKGASVRSSTESLKAIKSMNKLIDSTPGLKDLAKEERGPARKSFNEAYLALKVETELLEGLRIRFIPEAEVCLPCGLSLSATIPRAPWENFLECVDFCHRCRAEAKKALELLEKCVRSGRASQRFLDPVLIAERNAYFRQANANRQANSRERTRQLRNREESIRSTSSIRRAPVVAKSPKVNIDAMFSEEVQNKKWVKSKLAAREAELAPTTLRNYRYKAVGGRRIKGELEITVDQHGQVSRRHGKGHVEYLFESLRER